MTEYEYALDRLRSTPTLVSAGSTEILTAKTAKAQVEQMRKMGMTAAYVEIPGNTHMSMIAPTVPQIFDFFARRARTR
jgi:hypothetical protein